METIAFVLAAAAALVSAGFVMLHRNPVICAMALVVNIIAIAVLFLTLGAFFLSTLQVFVYAGAIMVLIVFVIMLLGLPREPASMRPSPGQFLLAGAGGAALLGALLKSLATLPPSAPAAVAKSFGTAESIARPLFTTWFYPFEILSFVLLAAMAGAILLAKREL
jgi:NADH-quinone oxidoreductase subunit J